MSRRGWLTPVIGHLIHSSCRGAGRLVLRPQRSRPPAYSATETVDTDSTGATASRRRERAIASHSNARNWVAWCAGGSASAATAAIITRVGACRCVGGGASWTRGAGGAGAGWGKEG